MTSNEPRPRDAVRAEIREFLSSRRAKISPELAGLPTYEGARRRVPGLRREEAALLAGMSPQYYVRLERGDAVGVSPSVIDGIAHALKLDTAERAHLLDLLHTAGARSRSRSRDRTSTVQLRPTLQRLVDSMHSVPAVVLSGRLDVLGMNALGRALFAPVYRNQKQLNNARIIFLKPQATTFFREWGKVANDTVALLRAEAGREPYDRRLADLIGELSTRSEDFRVRWAAHDVRIHNTGVKKLHHDLVGDLDLAFESLPVESGSSTSLVTYLPEPDSKAHQALGLLASWASDPADSTSGTTPDDRAHLT